MRERAAAHGRMGNKEAKRRGGQTGGLKAWYGSLSAEREVIRERLLMVGRGHQRNKSDRARAAQRVRGKHAYLHPTGAQAIRLAELGYYKREPYVAPRAANSDRAIYRPEMGPIPEGWLAGRPHPCEYPTSSLWRRAVDSWDCNEGRAIKEARWAAEAMARGEGSGGMDDEEDGEDDE